MERDKSRVAQLFSGQLHNVVRCSACGNESRAFDPFWDLSVPLPHGDCPLESCLAAFVTPETLSGDDAAYCRHCKKHQTSTKTMRIMRCPPVLVVHLKRFAFSSYKRTKLGNNIRIPHQLDVGPFMSPEGA